MAEEIQSNGQSSSEQQFVYQQQVRSTNGIGTAGFVLALVALFFGWVPVLGWISWILGLIFSAIGMTRKPKGLAIAGLAISLVGIILILVVFAGIGAALAL